MLQVIDDRSKVSGYLRKIYSYYVTAATLFLLKGIQTYFYLNRLEMHS